MKTIYHREDNVYATPFAGGGDIGINRVDTHEQWGRDPGDRIHLVTYDVTINKGGLLSGGFDNLREARAFLEGYVRGVDVTLRATATPIVAGVKDQVDIAPSGATLPV